MLDCVTLSGDAGIKIVFSILQNGCWMLSNMLDSSKLVDLKLEKTHFTLHYLIYNHAI